MSVDAKDRAAHCAAFLAGAGWSDGRVAPLAADASFRSYHRVYGPRGTAVLMDAPPPHEDVRPFARLAAHLTALGLRPPNILAGDESAGFLLLDDLGDLTFTRALTAGHEEADLYARALEVLVALGRLGEDAAPAGLGVYDVDTFAAETAIFTAWYGKAVLGDKAPEDSALQAVMGPLVAYALDVPKTLVLRDYHVDNLMLIPGEAGLASCGLLDFQDALLGPITYDLASLLDDERREVDAAVVGLCIDRYIKAFPTLDVVRLQDSMAILAAQRHLKVLGVFTRLHHRDGKPQYRHHMPRIWAKLERLRRVPVLAPLHQWLDEVFPPQTRKIP